ncbi:hypothetical protein PDK27_27645, partial [Bacillus cereus group sp. TH230-1LC]|nr:hypothetical protein [Bacillus cereus group sp. TH230-1LC]
PRPGLYHRPCSTGGRPCHFAAGGAAAVAACRRAAGPGHLGAARGQSLATPGRPAAHPGGAAIQWADLSAHLHRGGSLAPLGALGRHQPDAGLAGDWRGRAGWSPSALVR